MHPIAHTCIGWLAGHAIALGAPADVRRRARWVGLAVGILPDIDGAAILGGWDAYERWHHTFGHNVWFGAIAVIGVAVAFRPRARMAAVAAAAFALHVLSDAFGTTEYRLPILWPFLADRDFGAYMPIRWSVYAWPSYAADAVALAVVITLVARERSERARGRRP